jgi:uncharacterized protein (DUF433 family)
MAVAEETPALERGIYGLNELKRYVAYQHGGHSLPGHQVRYWITHALTPVDHAQRRPDYTFHDLVSLFVVRELVEAGVAPHSIRVAEEHLRARLHRPRPFATSKIFTDGVDVLYEADPTPAGQITSASRGGQEVIRPAIEAALRGIRFDNKGTAAAWDAKLQQLGNPFVTLDPRIQFGEPCVAGTRLPTAQLWEQSQSGVTDKALASAYDLPLESVRAALTFERDLASVE